MHSSRACTQRHTLSEKRTDSRARSRAYSHAARSRSFTQQSMHGSREGIAWRDEATRRRAIRGPCRSPAAPRCCVSLQCHLLGLLSTLCQGMCQLRPARSIAPPPASVPKKMSRRISTSFSGWPRPRGGHRLLVQPPHCGTLSTQCKGVRWPRPAQSSAPKPVAASDPTRLERKGGVRRSAFQLPDAATALGRGAK